MSSAAHSPSQMEWNRTENAEAPLTAQIETEYLQYPFSDTDEEMQVNDDDEDLEDDELVPNEMHSKNPAIKTNKVLIDSRAISSHPAHVAQGAQAHTTRPQAQPNGLEDIQVEMLLKSGWLKKRSERRKRWKARYVVLRPSLLQYYSSEKEYQVLSIIPLEEIQTVAQVKLKRRPNVFGVVTRDRSLWFQCADKWDVAEWVNALRTAVATVQAGISPTSTMERTTEGSEKQEEEHPTPTTSSGTPVTKPTIITATSNSVPNESVDLSVGPPATVSSATSSSSFIAPPSSATTIPSASTASTAPSSAQSSSIASSFAPSAATPNRPTIPSPTMHRPPVPSPLWQSSTLEESLVKKETRGDEAEPPKRRKSSNSTDDKNYQNVCVGMTTPFQPQTPPDGQTMKQATTKTIDTQTVIGDKAPEQPQQPPQSPMRKQEVVSATAIPLSVSTSPSSLSKVAESLPRNIVDSQQKPASPSSSPLSSSLQANRLQIALDNRTLVHGYLYKLSSLLNRHTWKRRWFVLRNGRLSVYKDEKEYQLLKLVPVKCMVDIFHTEGRSSKDGKHKSKGRLHCFKIVTPKKTMILSAESDEEAYKWVNALKSVHGMVVDGLVEEVGVSESEDGEHESDYEEQVALDDGDEEEEFEEGLDTPTPLELSGNSGSPMLLALTAVNLGNDGGNVSPTVNASLTTNGATTSNSAIGTPR